MNQRIAQRIVERIYFSPAQAGLAGSAQYIHVVPKMGIEGDRYSDLHTEVEVPDKVCLELSSIEIEANEAIIHQDDISLTPVQAWRDIHTHDVSLNHLVGKYFRFANIHLTDLRTCKPCNYSTKSNRSSSVSIHKLSWWFISGNHHRR
jgi:hypothetical protein